MLGASDATHTARSCTRYSISARSCTASATASTNSNHEGSLLVASYRACTLPSLSQCARPAPSLASIIMLIATSCQDFPPMSRIAIIWTERTVDAGREGYLNENLDQINAQRTTSTQIPLYQIPAALLSRIYGRAVSSSTPSR